MNIEAFCEGTCDQCGQERKGVRFAHRLSLSFLCWEHFQPLAASLCEPRPTVIHEITTYARPCCCQRIRRCLHSCSCDCGHRSWTGSISESYGRSRGQTVGISRTRTIGISEGVSHGESVCRSNGRSESVSRSST